MKPLLSVKIQRGNGTDDAKTLKAWESSEHQLTVDGLMAFRERQRKRIDELMKLESENKQTPREFQELTDLVKRGFAKPHKVRTIKG